METIISAAITGGLALAGIIITNIQSNRKIEQQLDKAQAVTDYKIEELTREMKDCAKRLDFERAAYLRDIIVEMQKEMKKEK